MHTFFLTKDQRVKNQSLNWPMASAPLPAHTANIATVYIIQCGTFENSIHHIFGHTYENPLTKSVKNHILHLIWCFGVNTKHSNHYIRPLYTCSKYFFMWFFLALESHWDNCHDFGHITTHEKPETKVKVWKIKTNVWSETSLSRQNKDMLAQHYFMWGFLQLRNAMPKSDCIISHGG